MGDLINLQIHYYPLCNKLFCITYSIQEAGQEVIFLNCNEENVGWILGRTIYGVVGALEQTISGDCCCKRFKYNSYVEWFRWGRCCPEPSEIPAVFLHDSTYSFAILSIVQK